MSKSKKQPWHIAHRAGRNINNREKEVLRQVEDKLRKDGYQVLGSMFARVPGLLKFYATTYKTLGVDPKELPPFGVTCVNFLNSGDVTYKVMGCEPGDETKTFESKWSG